MRPRNILTETNDMRRLMGIPLLKEQTTLPTVTIYGEKIEQIPMDTTITQTGNNIKIYSHSSGEEGGTYTVEGEWKGITKSLEVSEASLNNNIFSITIMVPYGYGEFIEPILEKQKANMGKVGNTYEYSNTGALSRDEITFNIDLNKNANFHDDILNGIEGEREIVLLNYPEDEFKLIMSLS